MSNITKNMRQRVRKKGAGPLPSGMVTQSTSHAEFTEQDWFSTQFLEIQDKNPQIGGKSVLENSVRLLYVTF